MPHPPAQPDPFPAALALQLQQFLATMTLPPALQAYATPPAAPPDAVPPPAEGNAPSGATLHTWIERLLREPGVMETLLRVLQTAQRGSPSATGTAAPGPEHHAPRRAVPSPASLEALASAAAGAPLLDTCATLLTPVLVTVLEAYIAACSGEAAPTPHPAPAPPRPFADYLYVLSAAPYQAVREVLAQGAFAEVEGPHPATTSFTPVHH